MTLLGVGVMMMTSISKIIKNITLNYLTAYKLFKLILHSSSHCFLPKMHSLGVHEMVNKHQNSPAEFIQKAVNIKNGVGGVKYQVFKLFQIHHNFKCVLKCLRDQRP